MRRLFRCVERPVLHASEAAELRLAPHLFLENLETYAPVFSRDEEE
jgi:hypothetical protein